MTAAVQYIGTGNYAGAISALSYIAIAERDAQWFYVSAVANQGAGNNVTAVRDAKRAVDKDPGNAQYNELLRRLQASGNIYTNRGSSYSVMPANTSFCLSSLALQLICCCCQSPLI